MADIFTESVLIIGKCEFPGRWETMPKDVLSFLTDNNHSSNLRIWILIEGITKKYTTSERSDQLYREINGVVSLVHKELMKYSCGYISLINENKDPNLLKMALQIFENIMKVFYNICWQDLPDLVEESMSTWLETIKGIM